MLTARVAYTLAIQDLSKYQQGKTGGSGGRETRKAPAAASQVSDLLCKLT